MAVLGSAMMVETIPTELAEYPQWVGWKWIPQPDNKPKKLPIDPHTGKAASVADPATWGTFAQAIGAARKYNLAGCGFVFTESDPYAGVDLDGCRNPDTGAIEVWAWEIIERFNTYAEISPSGTGVKLFCRGRLQRAHKDPRIELYDKGRFFCTTGQHLDCTHLAVRDCQPELLALYHERTGGNDGHKGNGTMPVGEVIPKGVQHNTLVRYAGAMRRVGMIAEEIAGGLAKVNERLEEPAPPEHIRKIVQSVTRLYPPAAESFNLTDLGNARRLVALHGEDIRHVHQWGWLTWTGRQWEQDTTGQLKRFAKATAISIYQEAAGEPDENRRKALAGWGKRSEAESRLRAMVDLAASELSVVARPGDFDSDPFLLNCDNGTTDLRTGELHSHRREDLITKIAPVRFDRRATCPTWLAFLERVLPSAEVRHYVRKIAGYSLTGDVREQELYFAHGSGANGKSTFINALLHVLGDYGKQAAPELLVLQRGDSRHPTELADLLGARFVASVEVEEGRRLAEVLVKQMTGGDPIKARHTRQDFFQFVPTHKIFFAANHKPTVHGTDYAIWRRIRLIPFTVSIPKEEQDKTLGDKLRAEAAGILAWAVEGCLAWQQQGLRPPREVEAATEAYRSEMDVLASFLDECCVLAPRAEASAKDLYASYEAWCRQNGEKAESKIGFGRRLSERGLMPAQGAGGKRLWVGVGLLVGVDRTVADVADVA